MPRHDPSSHSLAPPPPPPAPKREDGEDGQDIPGRTTTTRRRMTTAVFHPLVDHPNLEIIRTGLVKLEDGLDSFAVSQRTGPVGSTPRSGENQSTDSTRNRPHPRGSAAGEDGHIEYRVYNYRRLPTGRIIRGDTWGLADLLIIIALLCLGRAVNWTGLSAEWGLGHGSFPTSPSSVKAAILASTCLWFILRKCRTVLYQSVIPLPKLGGIQLDTTRGLSLSLNPMNLFDAPKAREASRMTFPFMRSSTFVPISQISTVMINEGLSRWNVRYYLALVKRRGGGTIVMFDHVKPAHAVLLEVYHGIREIMFDEWAS